MEETEEGEIEGSPLAPSELAAFCDEVARFSDALTNVPGRRADRAGGAVARPLAACGGAGRSAAARHGKCWPICATRSRRSARRPAAGTTSALPPPAPTSSRHWSHAGHTEIRARHRSMLRHLICDRRHVQLTGPCLPHRVPRCKWSSGTRRGSPPWERVVGGRRRGGHESVRRGIPRDVQRRVRSR